MKKFLIPTLLISLFFPLNSWAEDDSLVANDLYVKPLTYRELPLNYQDKPHGWKPEPTGHREKPIQWRSTPIGYREQPIPQLDEPRNGQENPPNFTERDALVIANDDPTLQMSTEEILQSNPSETLRLEAESLDRSAVADDVTELTPGYKDINPVSKARLQDFQ